MIAKTAAPIMAVRVLHGEKIEEVTLDPGTYTFVERMCPLKGQAGPWLVTPDDPQVGLPAGRLDELSDFVTIIHP